MALHIGIADAQQWLEPTKLTLTAIEPALEATAFEYVVSRLAGRYNAESWTNSSTTPQLIRSVESMWYAGMLYKRQYSENSDESGYGNYLLTYSANLLEGIATGRGDVVGLDELRQQFSYPSFWPNDLATLTSEEEPTSPLAAPRVF